MTNRYALADTLDTAEPVRLQAAFPEFSFGVCPGWRGPVFEARREAGTGDLYAVITSDAQKPWRKLKAGQAEQKAAADAAGQEQRLELREYR